MREGAKVHEGFPLCTFAPSRLCGEKLMSNSFFKFKQFTISQAQASMKVTTDSCLFGAWVSKNLSNKTETLLDIGAGTALLSLMIAQENNCSIDAVEIEPAAAAEAKENVEASSWKERISVLEADITSLPLKKYNCIVSNPPFYENDLKAPSHEKNIAHHSQELTLDELVKIIRAHLNEPGEFFLLLPYRRRAEVLGLMENAGLFAWELVQVSHSAKHAPTRLMIMGGLVKRSMMESNFFINDSTGKYSPDFMDLLKDYYLYIF